MRGRSDPGQGSGPGRYPGSFLLAFRHAIRQVGWDLVHLMGDMAVCRDSGGLDHHVGLENLYRRARQNPRADWPKLIEEFLRTVRSVEDDPALPEKLADAAERLLVRLGLPLRTTVKEAAVWSRPLDDTPLVANLVLDYPDRMCYVTEQLVSESGQPGEVWYERACENLRLRTPADCFEVIHEESGLRSCSVADAYDSSRALLLEALLPESRENGWFLIIPGRDELLVMPVCAKALPHVQLLRLLAAKNYQTVPYPISDQVYWQHQGKWHRFPIAMKGENVAVYPPPEFAEVLNRLTEDASGPEEGPESAQ